MAVEMLRRCLDKEKDCSCEKHYERGLTESVMLFGNSWNVSLG